MSFTSEISVEKIKIPKGAWLVVVLLFNVGALNYIDRMTIATMRNSIMAEMPMNDAQFGLLTSVFLWVYGLCSPIAGFIGDRFKRSWVIIGSLFVWSAVTILTARATTFEELLATRALMGISEAFYMPAALALILDYHRGTTQSLATGLHLAGTVVGQSLGFIGGWIAEKHSWNYAFDILGIIGIIYSLVLIFFLKDAPSTNDEFSDKEENKVRFFKGVRDLFKQKSFIYLLFFWGTLGIVGWMVMGWLPTFYKENFNLSQGIAGFYATAFLYPASIIGLLFGGFLADRWSKKNSNARILVPIIGLCIAAPCIFAASYTNILPLAILFFIFYALTKMFVDSNLMPILSMLVNKRYRATGYGILNMAATIVGGIGIYAAGILRDLQINLSIVYQIAALFLALCVVLLFVLKKYAKLF